jgi:hypothetical protein
MEPVRYSRLRLIGQLSPAHYEANPVEQTACMEQGSAVDAIIFESKPVIFYPGPVRRGKEWEAFKLEHPESDWIVVTRSQFDEATAIANAVRSNKRAMRVLQGERQKEIFWKFCNRDCVSHLDVLGANSAWVTELKVSQTSNPARFRWHALKMGYHCQLAFYDDAVTFSTGRSPKAHFIVCVEASYPHVVTTFRVSKRAIQQGKRTNRLWMERLLQCESADKWPGYSQSIVELDVQDDELEESTDIPF